MDDPEENPLHFENEVRKLKIQAETGAEFFTDSEKLSPKQESGFLDHIEAFNRSSQDKKQKKIKEILNNPVFEDPESITDQELAIHLDKAYQLLDKNNISLDVLYDVPDREVYRFIVEDLMEHELSVIDVPGMITCFTYEEFYPNDEEDLKRYAEEFVEILAKKSFDIIDYVLNSTCVYQDTKLSDKEYIDVIKNKLRNVDRLKIRKLRSEKIEINKERAILNYHLHYEKKLNDGSLSAHKEQVQFDFTQDTGYWYLQSVSIPSLHL